MKRKEVQPKQEDEEQKNQAAVASQKYNQILDEREKILRDAISYEEKTLVKLFNQVKRGNVQREKLKVYGSYLKDKKEEDDETLIDLESDLFSALIADIDKKLVYNPNKYSSLLTMTNSDDALIIGVDGGDTQSNSHIRFYVDNSEEYRIDATGGRFNDNNKLRFGTGDDLQIWHDGSNSYVKNANSGTDLIIESANNTYIKHGTENWVS